MEIVRHRDHFPYMCGAPKAQDLTAAIAVAAPSKVLSVAERAPNFIGAKSPIGTSTTLLDLTLRSRARQVEQQ
jgi:hypothetical protein